MALSMRLVLKIPQGKGSTIDQEQMMDKEHDTFDKASKKGGWRFVDHAFSQGSLKGDIFEKNDASGYVNGHTSSCKYNRECGFDYYRLMLTKAMVRSALPSATLNSVKGNA